MNFVLNFAKLCYHLVRSGNIKISAIMQPNQTLTFPDLGGVTIDQERAETFGLMTVSQDGPRFVLPNSQCGKMRNSLFNTFSIFREIDF